MYLTNYIPLPWIEYSHMSGEKLVANVKLIVIFFLSLCFVLLDTTFVLAGI